MTERMHRSVPPEILFIERCVKWTIPGAGRDAIVLDRDSGKQKHDLRSPMDSPKLRGSQAFMCHRMLPKTVKLVSFCRFPRKNRLEHWPASVLPTRLSLQWRNMLEKTKGGIQSFEEMNEGAS